MTSTRRTRSGVSSPSLKQSTLLFQSTKLSNSQTAAKGKKPARTESAPVTQIKRQASVIESFSNSSASSSEDEEVHVPKRRKVEAKPATVEAGLGAKLVALKREKLNPNDRKWGKQYSAVRDKMGGLAAVHGQNQTKVDHILRVFDLSYEYGPCIGTNRMQRWERAEALGLHPPPEVQEILMTQEGSEETDLKECVFFDDV